MRYDTTRRGLEALYKPYQAAMLEHIWQLNERSRIPVTSGDMHTFLKDHPESKSRASVIFSLNDMVDEGILGYDEESGKGGYHRVYYPKMNRKQYEEHVIRTITRALNSNFPDTYKSLTKR